MATEVSIKLFGDEHFRREIRKMSWRAIDMHPVLHDIGEEWHSYIGHQFETEGAWSGEKWAELKPETISRRGSAHPILIDSRDLVIEMTDPENLKVTHDEVSLEIPEAVLQRGESAQYGFHTRNGFVAPRKMVDFGVLDHMKFRDMLTDYLVNAERSQ